MINDMSIISTKYDMSIIFKVPHLENVYILKSDNYDLTVSGLLKILDDGILVRPDEAKKIVEMEHTGTIYILNWTYHATMLDADENVKLFFSDDEDKALALLTLDRK